MTTATDHELLTELHGLWFAEGADWDGLGALKRWFMPNPELDAQLKERFGAMCARAATGELPAPVGQAVPITVGYILACDQLTRNIHRGTAAAFACDQLALAVTQQLLTSGGVQALAACERLFALMPLQHSEELAMQEESLRQYRLLAQAAPEQAVGMIDKTIESAQDHHVIVAEFGRFPHRNKALGRTSTPAELAWLASGERGFGQ